jgi:DNA-binding response OmpR family regulator
MPRPKEPHSLFTPPVAGGRVAFLVHPDRELRARLRAELEEAGFRVLAAADPGEIERRLEFRFAVPEVVLGALDPAPGAGGGWVGQLRSGSLTRDLPVVALASGAAGERRAALDLGLIDLVEPPYDGAAVLLAVRQALRQRGGCGLD